MGKGYGRETRKCIIEVFGGEVCSYGLLYPML